MATETRPWALSETHQPPSGLRECVLRVAYLGDSEVDVLTRSEKTTLLHRVARWRKTQPGHWRELVQQVNAADG